ncbi:MAG: PilZ domain-containing protein [Bacillota bacterium]
MAKALPAERRRFKRFRFPSVLNVRQGDGMQECALLDMSFRGFLARCPRDWLPHPGDRLQVEWRMAEMITLDLNAVVVHAEQDRIGCTWEARDAQSFAHLKRMVEMNLADRRLLARELEYLKAEPVRQFPDSLH